MKHDDPIFKFDLNLLVLILISVVWALVLLWPHLRDLYRARVDFQNFYWMARFHSPDLFPADLIRWEEIIDIHFLGIILIQFPLSAGYALLLNLISYVVEPILFRWSICDK